MPIKDRLVHTFEFGVAVVGYLVSQEGDPSSALDWNFRYVISETPEERETSRAYGKQLVTLDLWHMSVKLCPAIHPLDLYSTRNRNFLQRSAFVAQGRDVTTLQYT